MASALPREAAAQDFGASAVALRSRHETKRGSGADGDYVECGSRDAASCTRSIAKVYSKEFERGSRMELNPKQLIDAYLDCELDDAGGERLCSWLDADPQHVQMFVNHVFLHRQLREAMIAENIARSFDVSDNTRAKTEVVPILHTPDCSRQRFSSYFPIVLALL